MKKFIKINLLFLTFILTSFTISAQSSLDLLNINISYGQTIDESLFYSKYIGESKWTVKEATSGNPFSSGVGADLHNLNFSTPGTYTVHFSLDEGLHSQHEGECSHSDLPDVLKINVSDKRIIYYTDQVSFSSEIKGGLSSEGIVLSIPIEVASFNGKSVQINNLVKSSGLHSDIVGKLDSSQTILLPGKHILKFHLSGYAAINTYISFDFEDVNSNLFSYYHLSEIK